MNILYMIGNGFDIHMGLATSYQDFPVATDVLSCGRFVI